MFTDLRLAVSLLTVIPTGARWDGQPRPGVAGWFPVVGLMLGSVMWGVGHLAETTGLAGVIPLIWASLAVGFSALITRMLHFDGIADVADAWWGGHTRERRLEIMSDPATGAFGTTAVALVVTVQVTAVGSILTWHQLPLLLIPALARFAATFAAWLGAPARPGGLGRSVMGRPGLSGLIPAAGTAALILLIGWAALEIVGVVYVLFGLVLSLVVPHLISSRMGGVTGDVMGASVMVVETILFVVAAFGLAVLS